MRNFLLALVILIPVATAAAEPLRVPKENAAPPDKLVPGKRPVSGCAVYGAGFAKVDGTDTCVKIGGAVSVGGSVGPH
jgi:hypothetical protein